MRMWWTGNTPVGGFHEWIEGKSQGEKDSVEWEQEQASTRVRYYESHPLAREAAGLARSYTKYISIQQLKICLHSKVCF